jgi:hypothetical protein
MVLQSKKRTLAYSHATTAQAALDKLVNHAGVPQDAVKAAIGEAQGRLGCGRTCGGRGGDLRCRTHSSGSDPTWLTLVGLCGRQERQAEEGGGGGAAPRVL